MADQVDRVAELEAELEAARKVIDTLIGRVERQFHADEPNQVAVIKAFANLESVVEQRTRELSESQARYRALYDHSPDMLLTVDDNGRITAANQTSQAGLGQMCAPGNRVSALFTEDSQPAVAEALSSTFEPGDGFEVELSDGRIAFMVAAKIPGFSGATQVGLRDITARRELVAQLSHARRLAALGHLAAGVAHEINNPLSVLQLGVEYLLNPTADQDVPAQLQVIHDHSLRIARIVQNLQSFAHPRSDEREIFPIEDVVRSAIDVAGIPAPVDIVTDINPQLNIKADRGRVEQVLVNLLNNASAALGGSGEVRIEADENDGFASIRVQDNGPGIAEDLLDHIFTPFVSGRVRRGSGLGLAIVWSIVREHGGSIRATNRSTGGAEFEFTIPLGRADQATPRGVVTEVLRPAGHRRFLVVDDEVELLEVIAAFITMRGNHQVVTAPTAEAALEILGTDSAFDAVLTDIRLPGMEGPEFLKVLERDYPGLAVRTVLMSGFFNKGASTRYLQKPFGHKALWDALTEAIARGGRQ